VEKRLKFQRRFLTFCVTICLGAHGALYAQQNAPHLAYVLPAGGQRGTTFQVKVGGQFLGNVLRAHVSGGGIHATAAEYSRPMNGMQATRLRDRTQELQKQPMDAAVQQGLLEIRTKLLLFNSNRNISPVLAETEALQISIDAGAEPGKRELRLETPQGLSNPLVFCVGALPEYTEKETINVGAQPGTNQPQISESITDMTITLPAVVNGRIKPGLARPQVPARQGQQFKRGDVDRYRFQARKGEHLVVAVSARELIPFLADAVPGWFQAAIALFDAEGREVAYEDDYRFHPDPVLHYEIPRDGEYVIEIKDAVYRGREDFIYRITLGGLPFVTSIFPLGGRSGAKTTVRLAGWNLPSVKETVATKGMTPGVYRIPLVKRDPSSNPVPFAIDTLPEAFEKEPNDSPQKAQRVKLPLIINGRIDRSGDWDVFRFEGRAGQKIVAEVYARRLDSPLDSVLKLTAAAGSQVAFNDDHEDKGSGLETHHADSYLLTTLPANDTYYLSLGDAQQKGGEEYGYRLRISDPRPDFELRAVPSSINMTGDMTVPITVFALRRDGFDGEISLSLEDASRGFILRGGSIQAGEDRTRLTLTAPPMPLREPRDLSLEGRATIQGALVRRRAVPAEDMMQAFAYRHLVPAQELKVTVTRRGIFRTPAVVTGAQPVKIPAGGTIRLGVQLSLPPNGVLGNVQFELSDPPEGVSLSSTATDQGDLGLILRCDPSKAKPGQRANLIVNILAERTPPSPGAKPQPNRQRVSLGTLPAIALEIIKP
jgi:hypothetical protein